MSTQADARSGKDVDVLEEKDGALFCEDAYPVPSTPNDVPELLRNLSEEERRLLEKKLVRRIDLRLLPMLVLMYIMNYLDRNNIASAKLAGKVGMVADIGLTSTQYNVSSPGCLLALHNADPHAIRPASAFSSLATS